MCFRITNLKYWGQCEPITSKTLQLLNDLSIGYPSCTRFMAFTFLHTFLKSAPEHTYAGNKGLIAWSSTTSKRKKKITANHLLVLEMDFFFLIKSLPSKFANFTVLNTQAFFIMLDYYFPISACSELFYLSYTLPCLPR